MEMEKLLDMILASSATENEKAEMAIQLGKADAEARRESAIETKNKYL